MKTNRTPEADLENVIPLLINMWRRFHKEAGPGDHLQTREFRRVVDSLKKLPMPKEKSKKKADKFESPKNAIAPESDYFSNRELLSAYILYPWIVHYQEALSLLGELPFTPRRVLDVCSGPAPFAFAALRYGAKEVYATDRNNTALELGAQICGRYGHPLTIRRWDSSKKEPLPVEGTFDLITLGYGLKELFPETMVNWQEKQLQFINYLLGKLTPDGMLLLVESSFSEDNRRLLELRNRLVAKDVKIQAPCIWQGECPALKTPNSPCYAQREMLKPPLVKEFQRALDINLSSLKMTYLLIRSPESTAKAADAEEDLYRVISPPIETYQGKRFYLCGTDEKKTLGTRIENPSKETKAFDYLRRGELISIEGALEQGHAFDLVEGSKLRVVAACGKPAPTGASDEGAY